MSAQLAHTGLDFEGIPNFRDFGGAPTRDGGRVRRGLLFRSAHHAGATTADMRRLADLGVSLVLDLRRPPERRSHPTTLSEGHAPRLIYDRLSPDEEARPPHLVFQKKAEAGLDEVMAWLISNYRAFPLDAAYAALFREWFQALAETDGAALVHCHAGKDRTGFLCAITLHVLGVEREAICQDYLQTNHSGPIESRIDKLLADVESEHGQRYDREAVRAALSADLRYLDAALEAVAETHGDLDSYLEAALGVTPALRRHLRERLVEG